MTTENSNSNNELEIRRIIEERVKAIGDKDVSTLLAHNSSEVLSFDVIGPLQNAGEGATRERAGKWFSSYQSSIGYEVQDLEVTAGETTAFCHYLYRVSGTLNEGEKVDMWVRATVCLNKNGGKWLIVHEHQSVPFDVKTGKASLDLKP